MIKNILIGIARSLVIGLLSFIGYNTKEVPTLNEKFDNLTEQILRHDELIDQEMTKTAVLQAKCEELEKRINKLDK